MSQRLQSRQIWGLFLNYRVWVWTNSALVFSQICIRTHIHVYIYTRQYKNKCVVTVYPWNILPFAAVFLFLWTNKQQVWIQNHFIVHAWRQRAFLPAAITHSAVWNPVQVLPEHLSIFPNTEQRWLLCLLKDAIGCDLAVHQHYRRTQRHKAVNAEHWSILFRTSPLLSLFSLSISLGLLNQHQCMAHQRLRFLSLECKNILQTSTYGWKVKIK